MCISYSIYIYWDIGILYHFSEMYYFNNTNNPLVLTMMISMVEITLIMRGILIIILMKLSHWYSPWWNILSNNNTDGLYQYILVIRI